MGRKLGVAAHTAANRRARGACVAAMSAALAACSSNDFGSGADVARVEDVNWSFPDAAELETKLGSLEAENRTLRRRLADLQTQLDMERAERAAAKQIASQQQTAAATRSATATPQALSKPVITAPNPQIDLPDGQASVEDAPRLVQPSFASVETVFENEARPDDLQLQSILWGVHLDSYSRESFAREGWRRLQRTFPDELGLLEPRTETVEIEGRGEVFRLIGGGFANETTAQALCKALSRKSQYCRVVTFSGDRLSLAEAQ
ncbi:MAG: hypothetical protein GC152_05705 [Alphaproteobacteria bacterium]|nr:hypothetical protein [Alphaproteobacteria bacterium]